MKILIAGASGYIGQSLSRELSGDTVVSLGRSSKGPGSYVWDPKSGSVDERAFEGVDLVINLAGENVASGYWTAARMRRIKDSRVNSTKLIVQTISRLACKPKCLINASAVGFYGDRGDEELTESSSAGRGYFPEICSLWEGEARHAEELGMRVVLLRFGIVFDGKGGALPKMALPFKFGVGGVIGSGKQWVSWITLEDAVAAIKFLIGAEALSGPFNIVSPNPITNRELTKQLAAVLHRPSLLPLPAPLAKLALGKMAEEMLLASTKVVPSRLIESGFVFKTPELSTALQSALS